MTKKSTDPVPALLRQFPMFRDYDDRAMRDLLGLVDCHRIDEGRELTLEGATGHESFFVLSGWAEVSLHGEVVSSVGPGQFVGEMSMLRNRPRTATVIARSPMTVLVIGPESFSAFLAQPGIAKAMAVGLADRLSDRDEAR